MNTNNYAKGVISKIEAREKFSLLVEPEIDLLLKVAHRLTRNATETEDLVQDCLLRAFRAIDTFDGVYPRAWLLTILRNTHLNRTRGRKLVLVDQWSFLEKAQLQGNSISPAMGASAEDELLDIGLSQTMIAGLRNLSPEFREVIYLVDIEEFTYAEAAGLLGIRIGTLTSRLNRARSKLRFYLLENNLNEVKK